MSPRHAGTRKWGKIIELEKTNVSESAPTFRSPVMNYSNNAFSPTYAKTLFTGLDTSFGQSNQAKKIETSTTAAPITHPIFGVDPNQNQNGYIDPNASYHQQTGDMMSVPPPPPTSAQPNMMRGGYLNPTMQNNNSQFPQQSNFQTSLVPNQQAGWNTPGSSYNEQQIPQQTQQSVQRKPDPPKEKPPLPEEFIYMQTVLEELKTQCLAAATDPRTKRKFVDVAKRLENLYDCLRDGRLTPATITALNQIIQSIQIGDYANALQTQTQIAFGSDFSQCAGFMPGLKVLVQSATDLQVYLR